MIPKYNKTINPINTNNINTNFAINVLDSKNSLVEKLDAFVEKSFTCAFTLSRTFPNVSVTDFAFFNAPSCIFPI